ncbi:hypothetical protein [Methylobacterium sp. WL120]|uniref:DUF5983 family protein n=1 Tax=Methylobacterium sp. WL120 TaxID=2603887 RepID=UPI0011CB18E3|nr:hypothetical protein [Methylobacterium sp. WL120]TXM69653.1 hypothetical protein FV229_04730 [Methylobacterium sp. WL120]
MNMQTPTLVGEPVPTPALPPVRRFLDLSTGHLTVETRMMLDLICEEQKRGDLTAWASCTPFGWFMWAHDEESDLKQFPADLQACMRKAHEHGCDYLLFDRDAAPADESLGLPFYEDDCGSCETSHCEH